MSDALIDRLKSLSGGDDCLIRLALVEIESLRLQLAAAVAACKEKNEALGEICDDFDHDIDAHKYGTTCRCCLAGKALAIQPDDAALKAWLGEPVAWEYKSVDFHAIRSLEKSENAYGYLGESIKTPLYAPKGMLK